MEYTLKDGSSVTEDQLNQLGEACEQGDYPGTPGEWVVRPQGRPRISDEELVTITVKFPVSMVSAIDRLTSNRSDFIRKTVAQALQA